MSGIRRFTPQSSCPICNGHPWLPKGRGMRCWGYISGVRAYCTRDELAGNLEFAGSAEAYPHRLEGACPCGEAHGNSVSTPRAEAKGSEKHRECALRIWGQGRDAVATLVEDYLRARGISLAPPRRLRIGVDVRHAPSQSRWSAMLALVTDVRDRPLGLHRTYLGPDGLGKAPIDPPRMSLGPIKGGAVRLSPVAERILVAEGIETALAASQLSGIPAWAALSARGIRGLELPDCVCSIVIGADRDSTGIDAAVGAARRWRAEGREVEVVQPRAPHGDFADVLVSRGRSR